MRLSWLKLKVSYGAIGRLLIQPRYLVLMLLLSSVILGLVLWAFNLNLLSYVLFDSGLPIIERLSFLGKIYGSIGTNFESLLAITLVVFSILFGINMTALVYVLKQRGKFRSTAT